MSVRQQPWVGFPSSFIKYTYNWWNKFCRCINQRFLVKSVKHLGKQNSVSLGRHYNTMVFVTPSYAFTVTVKYRIWCLALP